jgi:predicted aspartyl protease
METEIMGRVVTDATIENLRDLWDVQRGLLPAEQARRLVVSDALADTGSVVLSLPRRLIQQLGLNPVRTRESMTCAGPRPATMYDAVRLTIQDRDCTIDVLEVPDEVPILVGQVPLELLDLVVDPKNQRLIGNPRHGGKPIIEMY